MERMRIQFIGIEDDGLASRHSGTRGNLGGNALEAMQMFELALYIEEKHFPEGNLVKETILHTDDEDMVRVPQNTEVKITVTGNEAQKILESVKRTARGAALMAGCRAAFS